MTVSRPSLLVLEVKSLDASLHFYRDLLGIPLVADIDHGGDDRWISGAHAAASWHDGAFFHFALYQSKGVVTRGVQIGFPVDDLAEAHDRLGAEGVPIDHAPRNEPWGKTARYMDPDGNSVSLTETRREPNSN
jgi:catechol 2,3-dioxygenase-like lactoylglutathione lyase family enzyme